MDSTTDNSLRTLWSIIKTAGTPDYIAHGVLVGAEEASGMPDALFADIVNRRFPISDRANTWASAGYFAKTAEEYGYSPEMHECVLARIKRAADLYGIGKDVEDAMNKIAEAQKPAQEKQASDSDYCDPEYKGYPVFDKEGAELANDFFTKYAYQYGYDRRMAIAKNIMRKCAEYGVAPSEQVRLSAGGGFPRRDTLAEQLLFRANELMDRGAVKMAGELCKFAQEICSCPDEDLYSSRDGLFRAIAGMDEMCELDDCYGRKFCAPEEVIFDITPDMLKNVIDDAVPMGRETFSAKALSGLPRKLFEMVLPKERVDDMMEDGHISPKKLSVTIISLKAPETAHLLDTIKGFTNGTVDIDDQDAEEPEDEGGDDGEGESEGEKKNKEEK